MMKKICFVCVANDSFDVAGIFAAALERLGIDVEVLRIPHFLLVDLTKERLRSIVTLIKEKSTNSFVVFFPDTSELFLEADFMLLFSSYPGSIYSGAMKFVVYTFVPAGFVVLVPVGFLREPGVAGALTLGGAALAYTMLALGTFSLGLRRYRRA